MSLYSIRIYFSTIAKAWPNSRNGSDIPIWWRSFTMGHNVELFDIFRICAKNDFSLFYQIMNSSIKFLDILDTSRISEGKRKRPESIILSFFDFTECYLLHPFRLRPCFDHTLLKKPKKNCIEFVPNRIYFSTIAKAWPNSWNGSHISIWWHQLHSGPQCGTFRTFSEYVQKPMFPYSIKL